MPSKAGDTEKPAWTTTAWNWVHGTCAWTWSTCTWAVAGTWHASSAIGNALKEGTEKAFRKASDEDLLELAKKPETKALASDTGKLLSAVGEANITGVVKSTANITLNYLKPGLADDRLVSGSVMGATLGGSVCGPPCALLGGVAGGLYGHYSKPKKDDEEGEDGNENCNAAGDEIDSK